MTLSIQNIPVYDNGITEAGEDLMRRVHEAAGMGCWHKNITRHAYGKGLLKKYVEGGWSARCNDCGQWGHTDNNDDIPNPAYLTSLDAYRLIWENLDPALKEGYQYKLNTFIYDGPVKWEWEAQPHHHLEALARTLTVECPEIDCVNGIQFNHEAIDPPGMGKHINNCPTCNGKGVITVLQAWEGEWKK